MNNGRRKIYALIGLMSILTVIVVSLSIFVFHGNLVKREYAMQQDILRDFAKQESAIVEADVTGYIGSLYAIAEVMRHDELHSVDHLEHFNTVINYQGFGRLSLITADGKLISKNNPAIDISDRTYYKDVMNNKAVVTGLKDSRITNDKIFIVAVPITSTDGKVIGGVHATVNVEDFQKSESDDLQLTSKYTYIIDRDGTYILRGNKNETSWSYDNFFDQILVDDENITSEQLRLNLQEGKACQAEIISGKSRRFITFFSPISVNGWYSVVAMPLSEIDEHVNLLLDKDIYLLTAIVIGMVAVLCGIIIWHIQMERKHERSKEAELRERLFSGVIGFVEGDINENRILHCTKELYRTPDEHLCLSRLFDDHIKYEVHEDYQSLLARDLSLDGIKENYDKGITKKTMEYPTYSPTGDITWREYEINIDVDEQTGHLLIYNIIRNIDEKKNKEMRLKFKAERDAMTGLYNRSTATDLINQFLAQNCSDETISHAFVIIDLDNFKKLNDTIGHKMGDRALMEVAGTLTGYFRREDIVCRLGGDEFVVFMKDINYKNVIEKMSPLMDYLKITYSEEGKSVEISASAGIAMAPSQGTHFKELYQCADQALYIAKREGKHTFRCYGSQ